MGWWLIEKEPVAFFGVFAVPSEVDYPSTEAFCDFFSLICRVTVDDDDFIEA